MTKTALKVAGSVFLLVALAHLSRIVLNFDFVVDGYLVPLWVNWIGLFVSGGLSLWMFDTQR
ncbi:MAG: hypothetical protein Q7T03_10950 [Deltaproteobacteria bacterium]|nr:hypothetical protein [Deltaproteobacteria bacterium]